MNHRQLGTSDLRVPPVTFGAWAIGGWMWGGADDRAAVHAIHKAVDLGITCIDTAPTYGFGHSETLVGKAIAGRRDQVTIATKCGVRWDLDEGLFEKDTEMNDGTPCKLHWNLRAHSIRHECEQSLRRLGIDAIDLYQVHWPDPTVSLDEPMETFLALQQEGKIRYFGVSNFTPDQMRQCLKTAPIVSDQPQYNPLDRRIEKDVLPFCIKHNLGVLAYSPLARGILTGKVGMDRTFAPGDHRADLPWYQPKNRKRVLDMLAKIQPIADGHGATLGQIIINWVFSQPGITTAIVGARHEKQVEENVKAASFQLTDDERATIRTLVANLGDPV